MVMAEMSTFGISRGRNVLGQNVRGRIVLHSWGAVAPMIYALLEPILNRDG